MKKAILLLLTFCCTFWVQAQDGTQRLVVWQRSGEKIYFDLDEEPETTFESGQLIIRTSKATVYYQLENVLRYTYEGIATSIAMPSLRPGEVVFRQSRDQMTLDGLAAGTVISVYTLDGRLIGTQTATDGQTAVVTFANQPVGTYIVKAANATYKFLKR